MPNSYIWTGSMELGKQVTTQTYLSSTFLDLDQIFIGQNSRMHQARDPRVARQ